MPARSRTEVGGKITQFVERVNAGVGIRAITDAHVLSQATSGKQSVAAAASANFNGQLTAQFVRANAVWYDSNAPASAWRCASDGTGFRLWLVMRPTSNTGAQVAVGTRGTSGTGLTIVRGSGIAERTSFYVLNGGTFVVQSDVNTPAWTVNVATWMQFAYSVADTPDWSDLNKTTAIGSGNQSSSPSAGDPSNTLRLGSDGANHSDMEFADLLIANSTSAVLQAKVQRYIQLAYAL